SREHQFEIPAQLKGVVIGEGTPKYRSSPVRMLQDFVRALDGEKDLPPVGSFLAVDHLARAPRRPPGHVAEKLSPEAEVVRALYQRSNAARLLREGAPWVP